MRLQEEIVKKNKDKNHTEHICYSLDEFDLVMISLINDKLNRDKIKNCNLWTYSLISIKELNDIIYILSKNISLPLLFISNNKYCLLLLIQARPSVPEPTNISKQVSFSVVYN